ncbi:Poly(A) polymerase central domain-domain-containing protein [Catenaria anguillulae PL171]|uniref:Poly(A) polymerase n=1 Tax=Catenaria anguillulae PL171 TaxID=765915 RepID=A0A1Y2HEZ9_9FUNG|nr:Poly(A) polymerase central domain-domain-containing protein [Catenaria anguillulae PL171]
MLALDPHSHKQCLGVTAPVSHASPTPQDVQLNANLISTLRSMDLFPSAEDSQLREQVLGQLYALVKSFVRRVAMNQGLPEELAEETGGTIYSFGSFRLGVHGPGADIDTLCVAPKHVNRDDFFSVMYEMLKSRDDVTELAAVPDAFVPVITFEMRGVPIDLLFCRLDMTQVPENLSLSGIDILSKLDERDIRSLNGSRVTDEILRLVPDINEFRTALRAIKRWAKVRGIYSNVMGFLGGVAWAMLVARVCQLYPNANSGTIVIKFFAIMQAWPWPEPILLKPIEEAPLPFRIWNPRLYPADRQHRMPIITPAYPSMCATHNVTKSTFDVLKHEFHLGTQLTQRIQRGELAWSALFTPHSYFSKYKYYLQLVVSSTAKETHLKFSGYMESRLRRQVLDLEDHGELDLIHPYFKGVERVFTYETDEQRVALAGGAWADRLPALSGEAVAQAESAAAAAAAAEAQTAAAGSEGGPAQVAAPKVLYTTSFYLGLVLKDAATQQPGQRRRLDIGWLLPQIVATAKAFVGFDEGLANMSVTMQTLRKATLPKDIDPKQQQAQAGQGANKRKVEEEAVQGAGEESIKRQKQAHEAASAMSMST